MSEPYSPFDILQWLSPQSQRTFVAASRSRKLPARAMIYQQAEPGDAMYRLVSGSVRLSVMRTDGRELIYQLFEPGDCFGTSSLVDDEPRPQTAEAFEDVDLQRIDRAALDQLRHACADMNDALLRLLSRHMRLLSDHFAGSSLDELACRVAQRLIDTVDAFGVEIADGFRLGTRLPQSELALMVGSTRQSVNKALHDFQLAGLVVVQHNGIVVRDLSRLRDIARDGSRLRSFAA
ncbi:Crp/Fnr family transcriptional regulator [Novosphingobium sp. PASSN1]|uniref:Crp/Fnr family transcriptional regulator n=1 Tax=Novosphingobium sp. PASSN1 TaxID=2015561 RepID=UPI000BD75CE1|nr:Crp/Fnr family transcriptional regulator [Novosphingobium sp. PASSN1]OYU34328.1 MAG: Crp/Fnr family transcriptional regulator [Novosphingobium sp. PASSN1]